MQIIKETVNELTAALEAFSMSLRDLNETVEDILLIYEKASQQEQTEALRMTKELKLYTIQHAVGFHLDISIDEMKSQTRKRPIVEARQLAMLLCRDLLDPKLYSLKKVGEAFGGRDHSTVIYSCETALDLIETDKNFRKHYFAIKEKIKHAETEINDTFVQSGD